MLCYFVQIIQLIHWLSVMQDNMQLDYECGLHVNIIKKHFPFSIILPIHAGGHFFKNKLLRN